MKFPWHIVLLSGPTWQQHKNICLYVTRCSGLEINWWILWSTPIKFEPTAYLFTMISIHPTTLVYQATLCSSLLTTQGQLYIFTHEYPMIGKGNIYQSSWLQETLGIQQKKSCNMRSTVGKLQKWGWSILWHLEVTEGRFGLSQLTSNLMNRTSHPFQTYPLYMTHNASVNALYQLWTLQQHTEMILINHKERTNCAAS